MAPRSYHPLAKAAFAAAALLTLLTLTLHGRHAAGPHGPTKAPTPSETFEFSASQQ
ncbi:MAG TPA: hypothetical protein VK961_07385 [Chthoniobacter sp.]|nr:hypothetical protein [Chthoniobacter sp.]